MTKPWWTRALLGRTTVSNPLQDDDSPDPQFETQWRSVVKVRLFAIFAALGLWVAALEGRLIWIQVKDHQLWTDQAKKQQEDTDPIDAPRGEILDRNGRALASSVPSYDLIVDPKAFRAAKAAKDKRDQKNTALGKVPKAADRELATLLRDWPSFVGVLCNVLTDCGVGEQATLLTKLDTPTARGVLIRKARDLSPDAMPALEDLVAKLGKEMVTKGILSLVPKDVRYYPNMEMASQAIGFVNGEGEAKAGVEAQFESLLKGTPGTKFKQVDANQTEIYTSIIKVPQPGVTLELTIDLNLQAIVERELHRVMEEAGALAATAVILDSATGEVLAIASLPNYNPNLRGQGGPEAQRNRATQDRYEPGSTFKMVTLAAALNEGVVNTNTIIDTNPGTLMVEGRPTPIREDRGHNYGALTPQGVLVKSSNVGAAKIGLMLGAEKMMQYAKAMGFADPAPASPREFFSAHFGGITVPKSGFGKPTLAVVSYGYGVNASPLQIATAMNVFATGGLLMRPRLIHATIQNGVRTVMEPEVLGHPITPETAATMVTMLESVVEDGTGAPAKLERYRIAGKTGTTKKVGAGGYSETDYLVSFVGFVPSRRPKFTIGVLVDRPTKMPAYGGAVSAPVFKRIAEAALHYVGEPPSVNPPPAVVVTETRPQVPRPVLRPADPVFVNAVGVPTLTMPDLGGLTLRDAIHLMPAGLTIEAHGDGVVVSQSPAPGEAITTTRGVLRLQSQPVKTGGSNR